MKKLLITTMAAVSVGLCAKAADYDGTKTSFENYDAGAALLINDDDEERVWTSSATDPLFVISNKTDFANWTKPSRPDYWATSSDEKALTIDTDAPLFCHVNNRNTSYDFSDGPIFFDSVVQFTATDVAAKPDSADKLRVWLYTSPDDVGTTPGLFDETSRKTCLVVTAGKYDGELSSSNLNAEHYEVQIEGVEIQPDTWHRLTIKAIADIDPRADFYTPAFEIWVDGKPVTYGADKKTQFPSLKRGVVNETLQCVAFDGKGAVDDIVFTTTPPEFAGEDGADDPKVFALNLSISADEDAEATVLTVYADGEEAFPEDDGSRKLNVGTENALAWVSCAEGYKVINEGATYDKEGGYWIVPINVAGATENGTVNVTITVEKAGGGSGEEPEDPAKPTIGGAAVETAEAFIAAANSGATIKVPADWTLVDNTLKDAKGEEYATFAEYYTVTLASDGTGTITLELNNKAEPTIDETAADKGDAIVVTDVVVALGVTNAKVGLWYGAQAYSDVACTTKIGDEPTGWEQAKGTTVTVRAVKPDAGTAFFKVVVDDQDHTPPPAAVQE